MYALRHCILFAAALLVVLPTSALAMDHKGGSEHGPGSRGRGQDGRGHGHGPWQGQAPGPWQDQGDEAPRGGREERDASVAVVCHVTGSDSNGVVALVLPEPAARAHERHGDILLDGDQGDVSQRCRDAVDGFSGVERPSGGQCLGQGSLPQIPTAVASQSGRVTLSWHVDAFAARYRIYAAARSFGGLMLVQVVPDGGTSSATVSGLVPGQTYSFEVRAVRLDGMEQAVVAAVQGGGPILASANLCVSIEATTATTATLAWQTVRRADSYLVLQSPGSGQPFVPADVGAFSSDQATVIGLAPGRAYFFQVVALDAVGRQLMPSNIVVVTTSLS